MAYTRTRTHVAATVALLVGATVVSGGCELVGAGDGERAMVLQAPPAFPPVPQPVHNRATASKVALGERLFFEPSLSSDSTVSCGSCHDPDRAFAEPRPVSVGVQGRRGIRNAPSLVNTAYTPLLFWDGGSFSLENQVVAPLENPLEMDADLGEVLERLNADASYRAQFFDAFGDSATVETFTQAIAAYERTILGSGARFDRYMAGDTAAMNASEERGLLLFSGAAGCATCHATARFTDDTFRNNGLAFANADSGRARITLNPGDFAKFKVPSLRNVDMTGPYMHDGRFATLEQVVGHYVAGGTGSRGQDPAIVPLPLDASEQADLVAFLRSLTDDEIRSGITN